MTWRRWLLMTAACWWSLGRYLPGQLQGSSELVVNVAMHAQKEHRVGGKCMEELCSVINTHDTVPVPVI